MRKLIFLLLLLAACTAADVPPVENVTSENITLHNITPTTTLKITNSAGDFRVYGANITPLKVRVGDRQELIVWTDFGVRNITAVTELDNSVAEIPLYPMPSDDRLLWNNSWHVHDTHSETYHTVFVVSGQNETINITLAWSDPCEPSLTGSWTLDGDCTFTDVEGVENGNFVVASGYTLTLQNTFVWYDGYSITMSGGTIAIDTGGSLKKGNICYQDSDGDNYIGSQEFTAGSCSPGYSSGRGTMSGYDCYDSNSNAKPSQTNYYTSDRGDGSFDYNCDGSETVRWSSYNCYEIFGGVCGGQSGYNSKPPGCGTTQSDWQDVANCYYDSGTSSCKNSVPSTGKMQECR